MESTTWIAKARGIADEVVAPQASTHDKLGEFPTAAVKALGEVGLMALGVPETHGGLGVNPTAFLGIASALAQADASVGMVYTMHVCGTLCLGAAADGAQVGDVLSDIAKGKHLTTLAFSEKGSRSHFWAPVSRAQEGASGVRLSANKSWVTSAEAADSYVVSVLSPKGKGPLESTLYYVDRNASGVRVGPAFDGLGLRANDSRAVQLEGVEVPPQHRLTEDGAGMKAMLEVVLPFFNLGSAAVALGLCRAAVGSTVSHLRTAQFEHMGATLGEALPNLRARLAQMQIAADGLSARLDDVVKHLEQPSDATVLRVLEAKAAAGEIAIDVTGLAMRTCGGAAFSKHLGIERLFRDAQAGAVMAPTVDVLHEFIGKALLGIELF